jgi:hypothetical protein
MKVLSNGVVMARLDLDLEEEIHKNHIPRKDISSSYIIVTQIWQEITISVATVVHPLQCLPDSNPN